MPYFVFTNQLAKDIVNHSVMQQNTSHWHLSDGPDSDYRDSEASSTVRIPVDGSRQGHMDLRSCGSNACRGGGGGGSGDTRKSMNQLVSNHQIEGNVFHPSSCLGSPSW